MLGRYCLGMWFIAIQNKCSLKAEDENLNRRVNGDVIRKHPKPYPNLDIDAEPKYMSGSPRNMLN